MSFEQWTKLNYVDKLNFLTKILNGETKFENSLDWLHNLFN